MISSSKVFALLALATLTSASTLVPRKDATKDDLYELLKKYDPIKYDKLNLDFQFDNFKGQLELKDLELSGFSNVRNSQVEFTESTAEFLANFALNQFQLRSFYELKNFEVLKVLNVQGKGDFQLVFDDLKFKVRSRLERSFLGAPQLRDLKIEASLRTEFKVSGINNDEDQSAAFSKNLTDLFNKQLELYLQPTLNKFAPLFESYFNFLMQVSYKPFF